MNDKGRPEGWVSTIATTECDTVSITKMDWIPSDGIPCTIAQALRSYRFKRIHPGEKAILIGGWIRRKWYVSCCDPSHGMWVRDSYFRVYVPRRHHTYTLWLCETTPERGTWKNYKKQWKETQRHG